jgi:hypothetical protein
MLPKIICLKATTATIRGFLPEIPPVQRFQSIPASAKKPIILLKASVRSNSLSVMTNLAKILSPENVVLDLKCPAKRAFEQAGLTFENNSGIARSTVSENLFARERLGSTGLGHGVAVPHGRIKGLKAPLARSCAWPHRFLSSRRTANRSSCCSSCSFLTT